MGGLLLLLADAAAKLIWEAMLYQTAKWIGAMAAALRGDVDAILLSGGLVNEAALVEALRAACGAEGAVFVSDAAEAARRSRRYSTPADAQAARRFSDTRRA